MRFFVLSIFFLLLAAAPLPAHAWPPTFGPEFTFTNKRIMLNSIDSDVSSQYSTISRITSLLEDRCAAEKNCTVLKGIRNGIGTRIEYDDGFWVAFNTDPGVIEVQAKPSTVEEFRARKELIQRDVFDLAKEVGMEPHEHAGGGHIHMGINSAFGEEESTALRNFVTDFYNHPELSSGIFGEDAKNAPILTREELDSLQVVLKKFDEGKFPTREFFLAGVMDALRGTEAEPKSLKYRSLSFLSLGYFWDWVYEKVSEKDKLAYRLGERATLEFRAFRPQKDMAMFLREIELLEARVKYIKKNPEKIALSFAQSPANAFGAAELFHRYVTEMGLDWSEYKRIMPVAWQMYSFGAPELVSVPKNCGPAFKLVMPSAPLPSSR